MPTLNIAGKRVKVDDSFLSLSPDQQNATVDEIAKSMGVTGSEPSPDVQPARADAAMRELAANDRKPLPDAVQNQAPSNWLSAATEGAQNGMMFGWGDEIAGAMLAPVEATKDWVQGNGFDLTRGYERIRDAERARQDQNREQYPVATTAGELTGAVVGGGGIAKNVGTMVGRGILPAMAEGAAYGATFGAGDAKPGERLQGAVTGGVTGAVTGGLFEGAGKVVGKMRAPKAAPAPTAEELAIASNNLYQQADNAGISIKPQAVARLKNNMKAVAGKLNKDLRKNTFGVVADLDNLNGNMTLRDLDELRQTVSGAMKRAEPQDVRTLQLMKNQIDNFADRIKPADITGDIKGFDLIKEGRKLWQRKAKTELIDEMIDLAELKTSRYTQSGMYNTVTERFRALETKLIKDKKMAAMFTGDERAAIRKLAEGKAGNNFMRLLARFAPRGPVSFLAGMGAGAVNPVGYALPAAGWAAANTLDRAAIGGARNLAGNIARGGPAALPPAAALPIRRPSLIPGLNAESSRLIGRRVDELLAN